jgi:hypothetical protein
VPEDLNAPASWSATQRKSVLQALDIFERGCGSSLLNGTESLIFRLRAVLGVACERSGLDRGTGHCGPPVAQVGSMPPAGVMAEQIVITDKFSRAISSCTRNADIAPAGLGRWRRPCGQLNDFVCCFNAVIHRYPNYRVAFLNHHSSLFGSFSGRV